MLRVCALVSILFFSLGAVAAEKELSDRSLIQSILANQKDPYLVLGLSPNCTEADVKSAYKKLSKRLHPDSNSSKQASEAMAIVNASKDKFFDRETKEFFLPTKDSPESGYSHGTDPYEKFAKDFKSGSPEQKKKLIRQILRGSPSLSELHEYMSGVYSEELRSEIYHLAIRETTKPVQILKLISPLGLRPGGGNWIALWKNALGEELPHFFALN
ncbi:MAG: DnaJ domain-containing protein, partial [Bdellovibrionota bacterium]